ncbi:MAG TPA: hypothetical protein DIT79_11905 [Ruminococcaceae bacterium]|nr:hypothetical protein [Oscillospiraceae bacterium]
MFNPFFLRSAKGSPALLGFTQTCAAQNTRERIYIDYVAVCLCPFSEERCAAGGFPGYLVTAAA